MKLRKPDYFASICEETENAQDVRVSFAVEDGALKVRLRAEETPVRFLRLRWNYTEEERPSGALKVLGDHWERGYGDMEWRSIRPERMLPWYFFLTDGSDSVRAQSCRVWAYGVMVQPAAFCSWSCDTQGVTLMLDVRCGGKGVRLDGRELEAASVLFEEYRSEDFSEAARGGAGSVFLACEAFCRRMCPHPIFPKEPVYGSNNWYYAYGNSSHEEILGDTRIVAELTRGLSNRPFMVIDDGWQMTNVDGPWHVGNERFPDMKRLAEEISAMDVKPGIWYRPLADIGRRTPGVTEDMRLSRCGDYLDPSHPAVKELLYRDMKRLTGWGFRLIKHDYSTFDLFGSWGVDLHGCSITNQDGWSFWDTSKTSAEIVLDFYRLLREAAGPDVLILGCNTVSHLCAGLVELNRTGDDTSGRQWERTRQRGVNTLAFRMMQNRTFYDADADCVGITEQVPWELNRQWLHALAVSGSPLFVSCKPGVLNDAQLDELREAFAAASEQRDRFVPLNWTETSCPDRWLHNGDEIALRWIPETGR